MELLAGLGSQKPLEEEPSGPFPVAGSPRHFLAVAAPIQSLPLFSRGLLLYVSFHLFIDTRHWIKGPGLTPIHLILTKYIFNDPISK